MEKLINWLEVHQLPCFYKHYFGIDCPGCGLQSSIIFLLKGEFAGSFKTYPALLPTFFLITFLIFHFIFKFKHGAPILKISLVFTVIILVGGYVIQLTGKYFLSDGTDLFK